MRCTKCNYLSFEPEPRCRNCGHDLSLDDFAEGTELHEAVASTGTDGAVAFNLADATLAGLGDPVRGMAKPATGPRPVRKTNGAAPTTTSEFPLFARTVQTAAAEDRVEEHKGDEGDSEAFEPLVKMPARPRVPVAVQRPTPDSPRRRATFGSPAARERDLLDQMAPLQDLPLPPPAPEPQWPGEPPSEELPQAWLQKVGGLTRLAAALIDALLLGAIAAGVIFCTLRLVGLPVSDIGLLPLAPLVTLFLLVAAGYELLFTAACGQTVGKMAMGIRVVGTSTEAVINDHVTVGQAALRAIVTLPSVLALGIGFLPALVGAGLAVHDRVARTRVVYS